MTSPAGDVSADAIVIASKTDVGQVRQANEDSCDVLSRGDQTHLLIVADGMGGHQGGATASQTAVETIKGAFDARPEPQTSARASELLASSVEAANARIYEMAQQDAELEGMGTTVVAFHIDAKRRGTVAHVGDSRAYRYRNGRLDPLTIDHSVVAEMQRRGLLSADEAAVHPRRNEILRSVGVLPEVEVDVESVEVAAGDRILLCSDGLTGVVQDEEMAAIVQSTQPDAAVAELIDLANSRGGPDNITVQILSIPADENEGDPEATAPVELSTVGIEAIEARRRRRRQASRIGGLLAVVVIAALAFAAWRFYSAESAAPARSSTRAEAPAPAVNEQVPSTTPAPAPPVDPTLQPPLETTPQQTGPLEDRFERDSEPARRGIPRNPGTR